MTAKIRFKGSGSIDRGRKWQLLDPIDLAPFDDPAGYQLWGRDRNAGYPAPLAQIPAGAANAPGSCLEFWRQSELPDTDG